MKKSSLFFSENQFKLILIISQNINLKRPSFLIIQITVFSKRKVTLIILELLKTFYKPAGLITDDIQTLEI